MLVERRTTDVFRSLRRRNKRINRHQVAAVIEELRRTNVPYKVKRKGPELQTIFDATCQVFQKDISSKSQKREYVYSRFVFMYKALRYGFTEREVGDMVKRDRTSVIHGKKTYNNLLLDRLFLSDYISKEIEIDKLIRNNDKNTNWK